MSQSGAEPGSQVTVLHLIAEVDWRALGEHDPVTNASLETEGFIHCTGDPAVMLEVANAFYRDREGDFVVLHIDVGRLTSRCLWEDPAPPRGASSPAPSATSFPHVYGPIDRVAISGVQMLHRDRSGRFTGYDELTPTA